MNECLTEDQIAFYRENGYLVLPAHLSAQIIAEAKAEIERLSVHAGEIDRSDHLIDVEDSHRRDDPRIRRIKRPDLQSAFFDRLMRSDDILGPARDLIGANIRMHTTKLNMKKAEYGSPVQWHQDFAFYPHTNGDVLAIGVVFDDIEMENGPLQVFPGSHKGPILEHHSEGIFVGAVDIESAGLQLEDAVALTGPAGTITIHHGHMLHGSALNQSARDRQILFFEMMAADAFPVYGGDMKFDTLDDYNKLMLCGEPTNEPRLEAVSCRVPLPKPEKAGSIYEIQAGAKQKSYQTYEEAKATT